MNAIAGAMHLQVALMLSCLAFGLTAGIASTRERPGFFRPFMGAVSAFVLSGGLYVGLMLVLEAMGRR